MTSTFSGLEIGKRSIAAHQTAINTTGHNLSNLDTEGYSRQRAEFTTFEPIYLPGLNREETPGQIGQGVVIERVERIRDELLDKRIIAEENHEGYWETRNQYLSDIARMYNEPTDSSVRSKLDAFWNSWQELAIHPSDLAPRQEVVETGKTLVDAFHNRFQSLKAIQDMAESDIQLTVKQVNDYSTEIAALNETITKVLAQGDNPNDLKDRRDLLVDKLSKLVDITVDQSDPDEFMVHTAGNILVQGRIGRQFDLVRNIETEGYSNIVWQETQEDAAFRGGSLAALVEMRDVTIEEELRDLDSMVMNFTDLVNESHRPGYGSNGRTGLDFFVERPYVTNVDGNFDRSGDGEYDSSYIFRISGNNTLEPQAQIGLEGTMTFSTDGGNVEIPYYAVDTVEEVVTRINNAGADVVARLDRDGRLSLKGTPTSERESPDFVIRHVEDSGHFLAGYSGILNASGPEGAYDWTVPDAVANLQVGAQNYSVAPVAHPSGWIEINPAILKDVGSVASGYGQNGRAANIGNGDAASSIASIRNNKVMVGHLNTFDDYFRNAVAKIGSMSQEAGRETETYNKIMKQLLDQRESISGVNLDEEFTKLIKYQQGYSAAARFINTMNELYDVLINRMGV
jgi:flagellar hook-associated protein 1 FlgK